MVTISYTMNFNLTLCRVGIVIYFVGYIMQISELATSNFMVSSGIIIYYSSLAPKLYWVANSVTYHF